MKQRPALEALIDWDKVAVCEHNMTPIIVDGDETRICRRCGVLPAVAEPESVIHWLPDFFGGRLDQGIIKPKLQPGQTLRVVPVDGVGE